MTGDMPRWKKGETDFTVSVNIDNNGGYVCRLPKPMIEQLGIKDKIRFRLSGKQAEVVKP